jgi:hypothetical protein
VLPSGRDPRATVWAQPSCRGRYRCESLAIYGQTGFWVIPTNVLDQSIQLRTLNLWRGVACPFGRLVFTSITPSYRPLSETGPFRVAPQHFGEIHTFIIGRGKTL